MDPYLSPTAASNCRDFSLAGKGLALGQVNLSCLHYSAVVWVYLSIGVVTASMPMKSPFPPSWHELIYFRQDPFPP